MITPSPTFDGRQTAGRKGVAYDLSWCSASPNTDETPTAPADDAAVREFAVAA